MNSYKYSVAALIIFCVCGLSPSTSNGAEKDKATKSEPVPEARQFVSNHSGRFNGQRIDYTVTAGETYLLDDKEKPKAAIFTFAYTKAGVTKDEVRPVTFVWNGGPGSASLWLHMGTFGPQRVSVPSDAGHPGPPPYTVVAAPETILDVTDLVFVDPVGTGYSRALGTHKPKEFWGLNEDAQSMAEFIQTWVTDNGRWNSPRFLLGESFGTTRAAKVANILESDLMMGLNGLIFVSQALDYTGSSPYIDHNLIAYVTYVPTMAATAAYHGKVNPKPEDLAAFVQSAREFSTDELLPALFKGNTLSRDEFVKVRDRLAYFTGLSQDYVERANLRINAFRFAKELLRDRGLGVGLLDSRYTGQETDLVSANLASDSASDAISAAFKAALMNYIRADLGVDWNRVYLAPADPNLSSQWRYRTVPDGQSWEPTSVNTAPDLANAMRVNPAMRVFVANGYYDLVTPFFDAEYTLNRHGIGSDRVDYEYYGGGHMMYVNEPSRTQLLEDIRNFIVKELQANP